MQANWYSTFQISWFWTILTLVLSSFLLFCYCIFITRITTIFVIGRLFWASSLSVIMCGRYSLAIKGSCLHPCVDERSFLTFWELLHCLGYSRASFWLGATYFQKIHFWYLLETLHLGWVWTFFIQTTFRSLFLTCFRDHEYDKTIKHQFLLMHSSGENISSVTTHKKQLYILFRVMLLL